MKLPTKAPCNSSVQAKCLSCSQVFKNKIALRRHKNLYHSNTFRFKCADCGKVLSSRQNLNEHRNIHLDLKPHICDFEGCQMQFRQGSQLSVHKRIHKAIVQYRSFVKEGAPLRLTDCLRDINLQEPRSMITISGWVKLPPITDQKPEAKLPTLQLAH